MKAFVLAAGLGTRLGMLTADTPKCLMPVGSSTILELVVRNLKSAGVTGLVINLHHHAEKVRHYVEERKGFGLPVDFSFESELLETGGGMLYARKFLEHEESFVVHNADIYCDAKLAPAISTHQQSGAIVTLLTMAVPSSRYILFDSEGSLVGWENPGEGKKRVVRDVANPQRLAFTGISVVSRRFFSLLERNQGRFPVPPVWLDAAAAGHSVKEYRIDGSFWIDVGTPEQLEKLRHHVAPSNA